MAERRARCIGDALTVAAFLFALTSMPQSTAKIDAPGCKIRSSL
jgi:hypothetical protein